MKNTKPWNLVSDKERVAKTCGVSDTVDTIFNDGIGKIPLKNEILSKIV